MVVELWVLCVEVGITGSMCGAVAQFHLENRIESVQYCFLFGIVNDCVGYDVVGFQLIEMARSCNGGMHGYLNGVVWAIVEYD
eukprot:15339766-Ditylum_brightwellii.AAC.1